MYKTGAHAQDQMRIARMAKDGLTAQEISETLRIEIDCVKSFMEAPRTQPAPSVAGDDFKEVFGDDG